MGAHWRLREGVLPSLAVPQRLEVEPYQPTRGQEGRVSPFLWQVAVDFLLELQQVFPPQPSRLMVLHSLA